MTPEGLALVKQFEGCERMGADGMVHAYLDMVGVPTIGYGHTLGVRMGDSMSLEMAETLFAQEIDAYRARVSNIARPGTAFQTDAMTAFAYNVGLTAFANSSVLRLHNAGRIDEAADAFLMWDHAGGKFVQGLLNRRMAERALYLTACDV